MKNNYLVTTYTDDSLEYILELDTDTEKKYIIVYIMFLNKSNAPITIMPNTFTIKMSAPVNKTYPSIPIGEVAEKMENQGKWKMFAGRLFSGQTKQSTATITDSSSRVVGNVIITERDEEAIRERRQREAEQKAKNMNKASTVREMALPAHTLLKDKTVGVLVFFKKEKLASGLVLSFTIGNTIYEIPFGNERTK